MEKTDLCGRTEEQKILKKALLSPKAEMIALIGRRRVGKTFLIKSVYKNHINFEITGIQNATRKEQLRNFSIQLSKFSKGSYPATELKDWLEAFNFLSKFLESKRKSKKKMVIFLDELPWLATHRSGFLKGLSFFWNSWAIDQNIIVVLCGSAASWMIKKVIHHKGGLHNRVTKYITLKPFNLQETQAFFKAKKLNFDRYQILHFYMAMGGIPHYLEQIENGKSAAQNIDQICFSKDGFLYDEFAKLYSSLFDYPEGHVKVIRALAKKRKGLTRSEIVEESQLSEGGGTTKILDELSHSGFITQYYPYGKKKKTSLFRLTDEYSLFYIQFIEPNRNKGQKLWQQLSQTQSYISWSGYTFESICIKHLQQIKMALGISGVYTNAVSFFSKGNEDQEGLQVDLLIDRRDHVINFCEMKFYTAEFTITKSMAMELRNKMARFKELSGSRKQVFLTMITTFGVKQNKYSIGLVDANLKLEDLFRAE